MTTTDTDALTEHVARAIAARVHIRGEDAWQEYKVYAAAVLPVLQDTAERLAKMVTPAVAAEVRKAKAEALREAADSVHDNASSPYCLPCHRDDAELLHTIATEYETGDSDEHR
ncbi:hypothetical protein [Brachybacterium sp. GU-2]|uniref:hypothetical protein n=1 Tax=Brachybacterium sp. GU-2 TaxID=3069708 RepID=UPI00280AE8D3|nr:hypothetical protein [Brachybacterium sp. GU-2]WME22122.1 hypothetical protein RBL05_11310 [Brachybacterium sp. GU-2]